MKLTAYTSYQREAALKTAFAPISGQNSGLGCKDHQIEANPISP
jgi:hypothetical protein